MNVRFCPACRSLILVDFRFCPYCGAVVPKGPSLSDALEAPFARIGADGRSMEAPKPDIFADAEASLEHLEADMDLLLEALEKEHRSSS